MADASSGWTVRQATRADVVARSTRHTAAARDLADDARSPYTEAATAQPSRTPPSGKELARWLYTETTLGEVLFRVRARLAASDDAAEQRAQGRMVPGAFIRLGREG